ncbi:MAG: Ig-like domain-containing protein [Thermoplasmatota archaeon]
MKKGILEVIVCMLMIATAVLPAAGIIENNENNFLNESENSSCPDDFELKAYSVGIETWENIYKLEIANNGLTRYYCMYPEDREELKWSLINEFTISANEMDDIWNEITENDFFNLDDLYESPISVAGGDYASLIITGNGQTHRVKTENSVVPKFDRIVMKINSIVPNDSNLVYNALLQYQSNSPPFQPDKPLGEATGKIRDEYEYLTSCIDPEFNDVWYLFDWGDGTDSGWIGPYPSGEEASAKHTWSLRKTYNIRVKAKDECGAESIWSDPLAVSMPKGKQRDSTFFHKIFEWFYLNHMTFYLRDIQTGLNFFKSFFSNLLLEEHTSEKSYQVISEQSPWRVESLEYEESATFQAGNFTKVEIDDCNITVKIYIEIFGSGTTEQGGTVNSSFVKTSIENFWNNNGDNYYIPCKEEDNECDPTEPGCKVTFEAIVKNTEENETLDGGGNWSETGYYKKSKNPDGHHQIRIINDSSYRSRVFIWPPYNLNNWPPNDGTDPYSGNDTWVGGIWSSSASAKVIAHEAGHLMGLEDQYQDQVDENGQTVSVPNDGYEENIMGSVSKCNETANVSQIEEIVNNGNVYCPCECCPEEEDTEAPDVHIDSPQDGSSTTSPITVTGTATDIGGTGVAKLDYMLEWSEGSIQGKSELIDPPEQYKSFSLGPINLDNFIEIGDWITITIYATDAADNMGSDSITVTWIEEEEDTTPPVTTKTIGEPNEEGGFLIWPWTPIHLDATDDLSGVQYIHYEIWWDSDFDEIVDTKMADETVYSDSVSFTVGDYGIEEGLVEFRYYAVDNAGNAEEIHYQNHYVWWGPDR